MNKKIKKSDCSGCEDNFYNGNNQFGIEECWCFKKAKLILRKKVHVSQVPPWNQKPTLLPDCYRQKQYVFITGDKKY